MVREGNGITLWQKEGTFIVTCLGKVSFLKYTIVKLELQRWRDFFCLEDSREKGHGEKISLEGGNKLQKEKCFVCKKGTHFFAHDMRFRKK